MRHMPGVIACEPIRSMAARFHSATARGGLPSSALTPGGAAYRLLDDRERLVTVPEDGLLLSSKLAELLDVRPGERVQVEVLEGSTDPRRCPWPR